jgi:hypothetical protein
VRLVWKRSSPEAISLSSLAEKAMSKGWCDDVFDLSTVIRYNKTILKEAQFKAQQME